MSSRTTRRTVHFINPFKLSDGDKVLPPGAYDVETEEESLEGMTVQAYRRSSTVIRRQAQSGSQRFSQTLEVSPEALNAALKGDIETTAAASSSIPNPHPVGARDVIGPASPGRT